VLAAYVTAHGFGHLVRLCEVLAQVRALAPTLPITVVGEVPEAMVRAAVAEPVQVRRVATDTGVAQFDPLRADVAATSALCTAFERQWSARLASEVDWLRQAGAAAVVADIPPLPLEAAAEAGVPAIGLANFGWDWLWRHLPGGGIVLHAAADRAAAAYGAADLLLELPFAAGLDSFTRRVPVGFVARRPRLSRAEARARLGLGGGLTALLSFGGTGGQVVARDALAASDDLDWLLPDPPTLARLAALDMGFVDAIAAVDVVVGKTGYGIVTDCLAAGTPLVYAQRSGFAEHAVIAQALPGLLPSAAVSEADARAGRLGAAIDAALAQPRPTPPDLDGAARAAARIVAHV